jgi:probable F420-dependent oxidoreductase
MIVSAGLPTCMEGMMYPVPFAQPKDLIALGVAAERLGYHSVWGNDHMTTQQYVREKFPQPPNFWEILITFACLVAHTKNLKFGTGMLVTPMRRDIVVLAKQIATLDMFSRGRLILGVGVGAYREEFESLNPDFSAHRGQMVEESLEAFNVLFNQRVASFDGRYYHFENVEMSPKPFQEPIPIYVGGNSPKAIERTARYGHGWLPAVLSRDQIYEGTARLRDLAESSGRDYEKIDVAVQYIACVGRTHEAAVKKFKQSQMYHHLKSLRKSTLKEQDLSKTEELNLIGTASQIVEQAKTLEEAGVKHLCGLMFVGDSVDEVISQMEIFSEEVMPKL